MFLPGLQGHNDSSVSTHDTSAMHEDQETQASNSYSERFTPPPAVSYSQYSTPGTAQLEHTETITSPLRRASPEFSNTNSQLNIIRPENVSTIQRIVESVTRRSAAPCVTSANMMLSNLACGLAELGNYADTLERSKQDSEREIASLQAQIGRMRTYVTDLENTIVDISRSRPAIEQSLSGGDSVISALSGSVDADDASTSSDLTTLTNELTTVKAQLAETETRMAEMRREKAVDIHKLVTRRSNIKTAQEGLGQLKARVAELEHSDGEKGQIISDMQITLAETRTANIQLAQRERQLERDLEATDAKIKELCAYDKIIQIRDEYEANLRRQ